MIMSVLQWLLTGIGLLIAFDIFQQSTDVLGLLRHLRRERRRTNEPTPAVQPRAAIILALRGPDPRLRDTLRALSVQEYPDFHVHVVIDSEQDPVLKDVLEIQESCEDGRIQLSVLRNPSKTCSLKCSSLIQAVHDLDTDVEILAFIDGDAVPHKTWLQELVLPLISGEADVAGGNRWYLPPHAGVGTMARYFWNAAYMTGMWAQGAPWAGTMAFHRNTADRIGLLQAWSTAMSVDATLHRCMKNHGLKFKLVGSLIMTNREEITVPEFHRWVTRQMAVIRYSASATVRMAEIQVGILLVLHMVLPVAAVAAFATGAINPGVAALSGLAGYWLVCSLRMILIERSMRATIQQRGETTEWLTPMNILLWYPSVIMVHYIIGTGVLRALQLKQVDWRGIRYQLSGNGVVAMADYKPYGAEWIHTENHSIV
ncbi:MAG: glycosyltransferase [Fuerstiella sp.]